MAENPTDPTPGSSFDMSKVADLSELDKSRLIYALLCHKTGATAKNIDVNAASAAMGSNNPQSWAVMYNQVLRKLTKGGSATPKKAKKTVDSHKATPKKRARAAEDDDAHDGDADDNEASSEKAKHQPTPKRARKTAQATTTVKKEVNEDPVDGDGQAGGNEATAKKVKRTITSKRPLKLAEAATPVKEEPIGDLTDASMDLSSGDEEDLRVRFGIDSPK